MIRNIAISKSILLGAHFSISGGLHRAVDAAVRLNCTAFQMFTNSNQTWKNRELTQKEIQAFQKARQESGITAIASHTSYLINLASPDKRKYQKSLSALRREFHRCSPLKIPWIVLHPGAHMGKGEAEGIKRVAEAIDEIGTEPMSSRLLLETTAGQGTGIGHTFEQLATILDSVKSSIHLGVCLDTCHIFAAGYDIRTRSAYEKTLNLFDTIIGLDRLYLIHLNDSKRERGSRVDRHEHIGKGKIGLDAFSFFMNDERLSHVPKIIETPKGVDDEMDAVNLGRLRGLCGLS